MKRFLTLLFLLTGCLIGSCQCSNKPDVPPVDEDRRASAVTGAGAVVSVQV